MNRRLHSIGHLELPQYLMYMLVNGVRRDKESLGNLTIGESTLNVTEDLQLAS